MEQQNLTRKQWMIWVLVAMSAPLSQIAGTSNWFETIAASAAVSLLAVVALCLPVKIKQNWYRILLTLWFAMVGGELGRWCTEIWPDGTPSTGIAFVLLILATIASFKGKERAGHCAVILAWIAGLLFAGIIGAGLGDIDGLLPQIKVSNELPKGTFLFLIPAAAGMMGMERKKTSGLLPFAAALLAAVLVLWTGMMLPEVENGMWPFYEACKNLRLFGTVERFESLVSVVVSIGYFAMFSLLLSAIGEIVGEIREEWSKPGVLIGAGISAGMLLITDNSCEEWLLLGGAVAFVLIPGLWSIKNLIKK